MSGKIKAKDLSYDSSLPPFLQRLHAQRAGNGDADLHETQIARPKRLRDADDDDSPTIVDDSGNIVSKAEYEVLDATAPPSDGIEQKSLEHQRSTEQENLANTPGSVTIPPEAQPRQDASNSFVSKKRRVVKVVGSGHDADKTLDETSRHTTPAKHLKKKQKAVRLAFADD